MNGKGDAPRPMAVSRDEFARRWNKTFSAPLEKREPEIATFKFVADPECPPDEIQIRDESGCTLAVEKIKR